MKLKSVIFLSVMLLTTSCNHYINWVTRSFTGSSSSEIDSSAVIPFLCSKRIYNEFRTVAIFDILWLSKEIQELYATLYAERRCMPRSELADMPVGDTLTFYMLMSRTDFGMLATLDQVYPPWSLTLKINNNFYEPTYLKAVDLEPEYVCMLGRCLLKFRRPFLVKFDTALPELASAREIELIFSSVCFTTTCKWQVGFGAVCTDKTED